MLNRIIKEHIPILICILFYLILFINEFLFGEYESTWVIQVLLLLLINFIFLPLQAIIWLFLLVKIIRLKFKRDDR